MSADQPVPEREKVRRILADIISVSPERSALVHAMGGGPFQTYGDLADAILALSASAPRGGEPSGCERCGSGPLQYPDAVMRLGARLAKLLDADHFNNVEPLLHDIGVLVRNAAPTGVPPQVTDVCDWHQDSDGLYQTDCGNAFEFNDGGPWLNDFKFCGYCGKKLVEVPYEEWRDDDDDDTAALSSPTEESKP